VTVECIAFECYLEDCSASLECMFSKTKSSTQNHTITACCRLAWQLTVDTGTLTDDYVNPVKLSFTLLYKHQNTIGNHRIKTQKTGHPQWGLELTSIFHQSKGRLSHIITSPKQRTSPQLCCKSFL